MANTLSKLKHLVSRVRWNSVDPIVVISCSAAIPYWKTKRRGNSSQRQRVMYVADFTRSAGLNRRQDLFARQRREDPNRGCDTPEQIAFSVIAASWQREIEISFEILHQSPPLMPFPDLHRTSAQNGPAPPQAPSTQVRPRYMVSGNRTGTTACFYREAANYYYHETTLAHRTLLVHNKEGKDERAPGGRTDRTPTVRRTRSSSTRACQ